MILIKDELQSQYLQSESTWDILLYVNVLLKATGFTGISSHVDISWAGSRNGMNGDLGTSIMTDPH